VKKNPNSAAAHVRYGEALAAAGLSAEANGELLRAVKLDKKHTGAWLDLGLLAMRTNRRTDAERYFKKVLELTEGSDYESINQRREQALYYLGEITLDKQDYEEAAGYFKAALRIRRDSSTSYYLLAQALHGLDKDDAALTQLDAALAFDPNYAEAHYLYGTILADRGDKVNAAVHLVKAAQLAPDVDAPKEALAALGSADDALKLAATDLAAGRYDAAIEAALLARALDDQDVEAVLMHAKILIAKGSKKEAAQVLAEAEKIDPGNAEVAKLRALVPVK
jgi:tetratricopeptide (TPR) repeat protein